MIDTDRETVTLPRQDVEILVTCAYQVCNTAEPKYANKINLLVQRVMAVLREIDGV